MADTAAHLVERVLPVVPVRQWVLSLPFALRYGMAYDARLTGDVLNVFIRTLFGELQRRAQEQDRKNGNVQHLREHGIEPGEAEECFFHGYTFCQDERFSDVYILDGRTDRGRRLRLVFQDKGKRLVRIFTGWDLKPQKKKKR